MSEKRTLDRRSHHIGHLLSQMFSNCKPSS